jgi:cytohesin
MRLFSFIHCLALFLVFGVFPPTLAGAVHKHPSVTVLQAPPAGRAAEQDDPRALRENGAQYTDTSLAVEVARLRKAASMGNASSAYRLGMMYFSGRELASDGVAAYTWLYLARYGFSSALPEEQRAFLDADDYNNPLKFLDWTLTLEEMRQVDAALTAWPKSLPSEASVARPAERGGDPGADRIPNPPVSPQEIADLKTKAAKGDAEALVRLGYYYKIGLGVPRDASRAFALFQQAAAAGSHTGILQLASAYENGAGTEKNPLKARELATELAKTGVPSAQIHLGNMLLQHRFGNPPAEDTQKADAQEGIVWLEKAAAQGEMRAMNSLARYYHDNRDTKRADLWYERAAQAGDDTAIIKRLEAAERNAADLYKWMGIYLSCQPPGERMRVRQSMLMFCTNLSHDQIQKQKKAVDTWLRQYPKAGEHARERMARAAAFAKGRDEEGNTSLHLAILENDEAATRRLLAEGMDPNSVNRQGATPLHMVAQAQGTDAAALLPAAGAYIDAQDAYLATPLLRAAERNNSQALLFLLSFGADPSLGGGHPPLAAAVNNGNLEFARRLLSAGANPNSQDGRGHTPLYTALRGGKPEIAGALLEAGADPNLANEDGIVPLHIAVGDGRTDMVKALLAVGAKANALNRTGDAPLHLAVERQRQDSLMLLLAAGADPNIQNHAGKTALYLAAANGREDMVKALLEAGADANRACAGKETPLLAAVGRKNPAIVHMLLAARADPQAANDRGLTLLRRAVRENQAGMVKDLLGAGAGIEGKDEYDGATLLHRAATQGSVDIVKLLLAAKADPNTRNRAGKTVLDVAADEPALIAALKQAGATGSSSADEDVPLFDPLGRPMNKAAEAAEKDPKQSGGKSVHILLNSTAEADAFNETVRQERAGKPSPYLARAVLMDMGVEELARRIAAGADVNGDDPVFGRPFIQALSQRRSPEMIAFLLEKGADPNAQKPLLTALSRRYNEAFFLLLKAGADANTVDGEKTPVLCLAAKNGATDPVEALLRAGAKPDAPDAAGRTALFYALRGGQQEDMARLLLDKGAVPPPSALLALPWNDKSVDMALLLLKRGASAKVIRKDTGSPLHWAVDAGSAELLAAALQAGAPPDSRDEYGETPLLAAVKKGRAELAAALIKAGAPVNGSAIRPGQKFYGRAGALFDGKDDMLAQAVKEGDIAVIRVLVANGVALDTPENRGDRDSPLHLAVDENLTEVVRLLLDAGAKPDVLNSSRQTPLHMAAERGNDGIVALFLSAGADPDMRDAQGRTPLDVADNPKVREILRDAGGKSGK